VLASDWYRERLCVKQERDIALWRRHAAALEKCTGLEKRDLEKRLDLVRRELARVSSPSYLRELRGTIGADPLHGQITREALE
jgi:hypothetical protein